MAEKKQYLVVMGVPSIRKYVFGTDRLVEIRGASALLDRLNREDTDTFLKKRFGESNVTRVFVGGGWGQFIITANENELEKSLQALEGFYAHETQGGLRLLWGKAELTGRSYQDALKRAFSESEVKSKEEPIIPCTQLHTGYIRECDSCADMASRIISFDEGDRLLCNVCYKKTEYGRVEAKTGLWGEFSNYLRKKGVVAQRPKDFEKIGEQCSARKDYTALVYADGNAIGKLIKQIETLEQFEFFSQTVDKSIRESCHEALFEVIFANSDQKPKIIPADILLLGGDDLLVYLTAESAFPFAIKVAETFNKRTKERFSEYDEGPFFENMLKGRGMTLSLGIAYGKSHTPFSMLLEQADELLKSAKKAGSKDARSDDCFEPAYVDYHMSTGYNNISVEDCRKTHLERSLTADKIIKLYSKPYSLEDAKDLLKNARNLVEKGIPSTRLKRFGYAPFLGKIDGTLECLKLYTRTPKGEKRLAIWDALARFECITNMPWDESSNVDKTMLVDLIELADFCTKTNTDAEGEAHAA